MVYGPWATRGVDIGGDARLSAQLNQTNKHWDK